jgi:hypothetical protein
LVDSRQEPDIFLLCTEFRLAVGPTQLPIIWAMGVKWLDYETNDITPANAEVRNAWRYIPFLHIFMACRGAVYLHCGIRN